MRVRRSEDTRDLEDHLGLINYSSITPTIRRHRGPFRVKPFLRPISLGFVSWIAFLLFYLLFGRIMVIYFMIGGFSMTVTKGVELPLFRTVHTEDLASFHGGVTVTANTGWVILDPERHSVRELTVAPGFHEFANSLSDLCGFCDIALESGKDLTLAIRTHPNASYQDFVAAVNMATAINYSCNCRSQAVVVSDRIESLTHN